MGAGRPKGAKDKLTREAGATISEMAREYTSDALMALVAIAQRGESEAARISAANALLDRGYGKAPQAVEHTGKNGGPITHADASTENLIEEARRLGIDPATLGL